MIFVVKVHENDWKGKKLELESNKVEMAIREGLIEYGYTCNVVNVDGDFADPIWTIAENIERLKENDEHLFNP